MEILYDAFLICKIYPWRVFWCIFIFIAAIWTTGVSIKEEKSDEEENTLIIGFFKIMSKISITLLVLTVSVVFMSYFIKPQAKDTMPAFFTNGADTSFFDEVSYEDAIEYIQNIQIDKDMQHYGIGYIYFRSGNYDLAVEELIQAYNLDEEQHWYYAYNIGVIYAYLGKYTRTIDWFNRALELSPPYSDRGIILNVSNMIENYLFSWLSELIESIA